MKNAMFFIVAALLLTGCMAGTEPKSQEEQKVSAVTNNDNQEKEQGTAKEDITGTEDYSGTEDNTEQEIETIEEQVLPELEPLSTEMEMQLREDYYNYMIKLRPELAIPRQFPQDNYTVEKVLITGYYGTYNNCVAVMFNDPAWHIVSVVIIEGLVFGYSDSNTIKIWDKGDYYEIQEAFDAGVLGREDLENLAYYCQNYKR
ncbi:MAG: hypothetical protein FWH41_00670 [Treponema sp.]|nr:hypothetical protein [Treponema sp.]